MDTPVGICPVCHRAVQPSDYFCANCGKKLHEAPPSVALISQVLLYLGSIFVPPMGLFWGLKYLRQTDKKCKIVGIVAAVLTVVSLIVTTKLAVDFINSLNSQVQSQMQNFQGY